VRIQDEYPDDPIADGDLMVGRECTDDNRGREMVVPTANETSRVPRPGETILCDECNGETDLDSGALTDWGFFCWSCASREL
jgi:hypothetical protein